MRLLEFVKTGKEYTSKHGGKWFHIYFKDEHKSYRTALFDNMRNFSNWQQIIDNAERGDFIDNLRMKMYKGKEIVDPKQPRIGVMAQEAMKLNPEAVVMGKEGYLQVKYSELT